MYKNHTGISFGMGGNGLQSLKDTRISKESATIDYNYYMSEHLQQESVITVITATQSATTTLKIMKFC